MKPSQPGVKRRIELPFAGIMAGVAGGSAMWIIAALIVWALTH